LGGGTEIDGRGATLVIAGLADTVGRIGAGGGIIGAGAGDVIGFDGKDASSTKLFPSVGKLGGAISGILFNMN
jgi:hypothetical protein